MLQVLLAQLDALIGFLPDWARISVWGLVLGALTMVLYGWLSPQERIAEVKEKLEEARRDMQEYTGTDFGPVLEKAQKSLRLSFRQLRIMLGPTLIAAIPIIAVLIWMEEDYKYELPEPGEAVEAEVRPESALTDQPPDATWTPSDAVESRDGAAVTFDWPEEASDDPPRLVTTEGGNELLTVPLSAPRARVSKTSAWHWFFANPAGYLPDDGPVRAVSLDLPHRYVVPWGPDWMRTWHALFLVMLSISAVAAKVGFDID